MRLRKGVLLIIIIVIMIFNNGCSKEIKSKATLNVFIASSLTESMNEIKEQFESIHSDIHIQYNIASSSRLATQIIEGAECDIYISANPQQVARVDTEDLIISKQPILSNEMIVILSNKTEQKIESLEDLILEYKIIIAQKDVPVGRYALQVLENLNKKYGEGYKEKVLRRVVSEENNVKQVVTKIMLGEADAGIVYTTDLTEDVKDKVTFIEIPDQYNVSSEYWISKLNDKESSNLFYKELFQNEYQKIFNKYNFSTISSEG